MGKGPRSAPDNLRRLHHDDRAEADRSGDDVLGWQTDGEDLLEHNAGMMMREHCIAEGYQCVSRRTQN